MNTLSYYFLELVETKAGIQAMSELAAYKPEYAIEAVKPDDYDVDDLVFEQLLVLLKTDAQKLAVKTPTREASEQRILMCYFLWKYSRLTFHKIGIRCGYKDHSMAHHNRDQHESLYQFNRDFRMKSESIDKAMQESFVPFIRKEKATA